MSEDTRTSNEQALALAQQLLTVGARCSPGMQPLMESAAVTIRRLVDRASLPPTDVATFEDWSPVIRDTLLITRDLIDGKEINAHFLRISIQTILDEWPAVTKDDAHDCPVCGYANGFHHDKCIERVAVETSAPLPRCIHCGGHLRTQLMGQVICSQCGR